MQRLPFSTVHLAGAELFISFLYSAEPSALIMIPLYLLPALNSHAPTDLAPSSSLAPPSSDASPEASAADSSASPALSSVDSALLSSALLDSSDSSVLSSSEAAEDSTDAEELS